MKNIEKYKDKLISLFTTVCPQLVASVVIQINPSINSDSEAVNWLCKEAKEEIKITRLDYEVLKYGQKKEYKYVVRDEDGLLYFYSEKPNKNEENNQWECCYKCKSFWFSLTESLKFISWEDEDPYLIVDILERAKVVDDE